MIKVAVQIDPELERVTQTIVERCNPEQVILFGSRARGDAHADSDYDIMVVLETELTGSDRSRVVRDAIRDHRLPTELVVFTPAEFVRKRDDVGTIVYSAVHEGRVLYQRPGSTLGAAEPARVREGPTEPPESLAEWRARAESDYGTMETLVGDESPWYDSIAFHAHAGVEKLLKAVLVARHVPPPRTHVLAEVLARCPESLRNDERVKHACSWLDKVWPKARYPGVGTPSARDAHDAVEAARTVREVMHALALP